MNNLLLINAQKWLTELGIRTNVTDDTVQVNRDDVVSFGMDSDSILSEMKSALNTKKIYWVSQDDDWYILSSF